MSRDLESLWADDPPRQDREPDVRVAPTPRIWDDESDLDASAETRPSPKSHVDNDLENLWRRQTVPRPPSSSSGRRAPRQRRRQQPRRSKAKRAGWFVVGGMLLLLVADGAWASLTLKSGLEAATSNLRAGVASLQSGDLQAARSHFTNAREDTGATDSRLRHPSAALAALTPGLTRDVDVVEALGNATGLAAEAGLTAVQLAGELGVTSEGFAASLYSDGRVDLESLQDAEPYLTDLVDQLSDAQALLDAAPEANFSVLTDALENAAGEIGRAGATARNSSEMFAALPTLLGAEEKQTYFLAFQALSEARGTGGLIGLWGVLAADNGEISLKKVAPIAELTSISTPASTGPKWYEKRYGPFGALEEWQQSNFSPNLPVVSEVLLERFEAAKGRELDGVVTMDPIALGMLTRGTGPVSAPGLDVDVTEENAREVLLRSVYEDFESTDKQNVYLSALITNFWESIETGDVNAAELLASVGEATSTRHLAFYSSDDKAQVALVNAEAAGTYDSYGPNIQMIFHNNLAASKVDYFLHRKVDTIIEIQEDGSALVTTTVKLRNAAPVADSPLLDIRIPSDSPGLNRLFLNAILPEDAQVQGLSLDGEFRPELPDNEGGYPTVWDIVELEAGESATMEVTYRLPELVDSDERSDRFDFVIAPQPSVRPEKFSLRVVPPEGLEATVSIHDEAGSKPSLVGNLRSVLPVQIDVQQKSP
jgi:hypothetical protein